MLHFENFKIRKGQLIALCHKKGSRFLMKRYFKLDDIILFDKESQTKIKKNIKQLSITGNL